ncbi:MAG TPA: GAF domain-containing protein, partial [Polyangiaceae bacterium]
MKDEPATSARLKVLRSTELLDSAPERAFDRLTRLAGGLIGAPVALVSLVDDRRQFFKAALGLSEPWASRRETPLTHSFCQYATRDKTPLIVNDARLHPLLKDNLAIRDLDVIAYAGIPLIIDHEAIGAFCVIDDKPREWKAEELQLLQDLAESVVSEIELRIALRDASRRRALIEALLAGVGDAVLAADADGTCLSINEPARQLFPSVEAGKPLPKEWSALHDARGVDGQIVAPDQGPIRRGMRGENTDGLVFCVEGTDRTDTQWVEANGRAVRSADGKVIASVGVFRDVTERKRESDLYVALVRNIPHAAVGLYDRDLKCLAVDGELLKGQGGAGSPMLGQSLRALAGYAEGDPGYERVEEMFRRTLAGSTETTDLVHGDNVVVLHSAPVRDALGHIDSGVVLAVDVTGERHLQAALR